MGTREKGALSDFHFHTNHSDGSESVAGAIAEAKERGVKFLALTDHNNGNGVPEFINSCRQSGLNCLEGVEIYASFPLDYEWSVNPMYCSPIPDVTILGGANLDWRLFRGRYQKPLMDYWQEVWLPQTLSGLANSGLVVPGLTKAEITEQIRDFGVPSVLHDVPKNPQNWTRLHEIAKGHDPNITREEIEKSPVRWANRYLYAFGMPAYVLRGPSDLTVSKAVDLAEEMGGLLFAAHPGGEYANWSQDHLQYFIDQGGNGLEVWQYFHSEAQIRQFLEVALQHDLVVSGGSDWHGKNGRPTLGCWDKPEVQTPSWVFEQVMDRLP